jgi:uncharacterized protein
VVKFEWNPDKASENLVKHRVSFELAQAVWDDPLHVVIPDRVDEETGEQRWHAIGMVGAVAILLVVHTYPSAEDTELVRIISARKATPHERKRYENEA